MIDPLFRHLLHQRTLAAPVAFVGIGMHTGTHVTMRLRRSPAYSGISISRQDLPAGERDFSPRLEFVAEGRRNLTLQNSHGHMAMSLESVLSALYGLGIDNAHIELNGPEAPVLDGSAAPIVSACLNAGITSLGVARDLLMVLQPVQLTQGEGWAQLRSDFAPGISAAISSAHPDIGYQRLDSHLTPGIYEREIAPARMFGFAEQMWHLRARGLVLNRNMSNAILLGGNGMANRDGLRFGDEFVRRAALEALATLSLAGATVIGEFRCFQFDLGLAKRLLQLALSRKGATGRLPASVLFNNSEFDADGDLMCPAGSGSA